MPAGIIALLVVAGLIFFGLAHRALDRMRLTDTQALIVIGLLVAGSFIDVPILKSPLDVRINVGGALVPLALVGYLLVRADTAHERLRSLVGAALTAAAVLAVASLTDFEPGRADFLDPLWLFSGVGGLVGYLVGGRSRRAAFIAGTLGLLATDAVHVVRSLRWNVPATVLIGGAGAFDMVVLAGLIAVGLAELVGETRERLSGGPGRPALGALLLAALAGLGWLWGAGLAEAVPPQWGERVDGGYFTLVDEAGRTLTRTAIILGVGGGYIDSRNVRWRVDRIAGDRVHMRRVGREPMPPVEGSLALPGEQVGEGSPASLAQARGAPDVAIYFTHSDESYVPTSGTEAKPWGDIYRVGEALAESLRQAGYSVTVSRNNHNPHDGQAYTRSRRTALQLVRSNPAALVDVHRDAVPPQVYETTVNGQRTVKVRLVVGRQNPNSAANLEFAKRLKAVADRELPGIVEGIFIGEGDYNQDLLPRAILLEFGAHTNPLELAQIAARLFAPVIPQAAGTAPQAAGPAGRQIGGAALRRALWLVVAVAVGVGLYLWINVHGGRALDSFTRAWAALKDRVTRLGMRAGPGGPADREPGPPDVG